MNALHRLVIWIGGIALIGATAVDTIAVIGRNIGWPLHGSIELVQLFVLVAGAIALLLATLAGSHAKVHLLVDRLRDGWQEAAIRINDLLTALFFALMLTGSGWLALDLWGGHEVSEVIGVPWRWMRLTANLCFAAIIIALVWQVLRRRRG